MACEFTFDPNPPRWGAKLLLNAIPGAPFGATGLVQLVGDAPGQTLQLKNWSGVGTLEDVEVQLPAVAPVGWNSASRVRLVLTTLGEECPEALPLDPEAAGKVRAKLEALLQAVVLQGLPEVAPGQDAKFDFRDFPLPEVEVPGLVGKVPVATSISNWEFWEVQEVQEGKSYRPLSQSEWAEVSKTSKDATFAFAPKAAERRNQAHRVKAGVTLVASALGVTVQRDARDGTFPLQFEFDVNALFIPTVVALCNHIDFNPTLSKEAPCVAFICPSETIASVQEAITEIDALEAALLKLKDHFRALPWLPAVEHVTNEVTKVADWIRGLKKATKRPTRWIHWREASIRDLSEIDFGDWLTAEDSCGSLFVLCAPNQSEPTTSLLCCVAKDFDHPGGHFVIALDVNGILMYVHNVHLLPLPVAGGRVVRSVPEQDIWGNVLNFGNKLSSLDFRFVKPGTKKKPKPKNPPPGGPIDELRGLLLKNRHPKREVVRYLGIAAGLVATVAVWRQFSRRTAGENLSGRTAQNSIWGGRQVVQVPVSGTRAEGVGHAPVRETPEPSTIAE